jgi:Replication-relaxation
MPNPLSITCLTTRDIDVLAALELWPLTSAQLLCLSETFERPFTDLRRTRARLQELAEAGRVSRHAYATATAVVPGYYLLTRLGFALLHGADAKPPKGLFTPVGLSRQRHTHALANLMVQLAVSAHRSTLSLSHVARENSVRLEAGGEAVFPDAAFRVTVPCGKHFDFFVELDAATERLRSADTTLDSLERKLRIYEAYADQSSFRFRVLLVTTAGRERVRHALDLAAKLAKNPQRSLIYAACLSEVLPDANLFQHSIFRDHRHRPVPLLAATPK